jgi:hypothetical protein
VKLVPSTVGADPKKLAILGGLLTVAGVVYFMNRDSSPSVAPAVPQRGSPLATGTATPSKSASSRPGLRIGIRPIDDFKPSLKPKDGVDISKVDPTLRLDLLAKLNGVGLGLGTRGSVFDWGKAPPPPAEVKIDPGPIARIYGPPTPTPKPAPPTPVPTPPPPPIPLKFYGFSTHSGAKRAFFLDGDDIDVAGENDVIKNRYKVIKIGINSVEMEDLNYKHQQTLPLVAELAG